MYIENHINPKSTRSLHFAEKTPALIVKSNEETGKDNVLGVYIPRLMFGLSPADGAYEKTISISTSKLLNSKNKTVGGTSLTIRNYVELSIAAIPGVNTPQFVCGENVLVDFADSDIKSAFILPYSFGETTRRLTDIVTLIAPNLEKVGDAISIKNTYGVQVDTKNQILSIWTSDANGEKSTYSIAINAKEGKLVISDAGKRTIGIDTEADEIAIKNEGGCSFSMKEDVMDVKCGTLNVEVENDTNIKSNTLKRKIETISTEATEDKEKIDTLSFEGNTYKRKYNSQSVEGSSYEHKTSKWKVDSPISGFTKVLTADSFSIWPSAGMTPLPTNATITSSGMGNFGTPNVASIPLAKAQPIISTLTAMAAIIDSIGAIHCIPPTLSATVAASSGLMASSCVNG